MRTRPWKKLLAASVAGVMAASMLPTAALAAEVSDQVVYQKDSVTYRGVTFQRETEGTYKGLPLFDAQPDHLDEYLDVYIDYIGLDGMVRIALEKRDDYTLRNSYTISEDYSDPELAGKTITWENENAGAVIPGSPKFSSPEAVQGYSTNFPAQIGMGQTWNKELLAEEGRVVGTEKLYSNAEALATKEGSYLSDANLMVSTALTDIRFNPLSGRIDESYAEDPYLASMMVDAMAGGVTGHDQSKSDGGFWQMAFVDTKHFTNYIAQWQRNAGSFNNSARGLLEYVARSAYRAFENNNIGCFMTTYGTTNYVPNGMSPMIQYVKSMSDYPISTINDNGAETAPQQRLGNDYMSTYWPRRAEQILSQAFANASAGYQQSTSDDQCDDIYATVYAIQSGKYGATAEDFVEQAQGAIINQIRCGLLNERDPETGLPLDYPFLDVVTDGTVYDYTNPDHQAVALAAAEESTVLLKNNGLLPLSADADLVVAGQAADARFTTTYTGTAYAGDNEELGLTTLGGIMALTGKSAEELHYDSGAKQVKLRTSTGYLTTDGTLEGTNANATADDASVFEVYAWGQDDSISLLDTLSNRWFGYTSGRWGSAGSLSMADNALELGGRSVNESNGTINSSTMPSAMRREWVDEENGSFRLLANSITSSFGGGFETSYYGQGMYLKVDDTTAASRGTIGLTEALGDAGNADQLRTSDTVFTEEVVSEPGAQLYTEGDAAIVVVGAYSRYSGGEGTDRIDLDLGEEQYELCHNVAAAYPGKTVVVVKVSSPVLLEELENDPNIGAIIYQPYAGEYEGLGLANILFGEAAPTGRLVNTWYATEDALPVIDGTVIHNNWEQEGVTLDDLDPARDVLMTNGDPYDTQLSYMYNQDHSLVTYEFGYGLSYSSFAYSGFSAPSSVNAADGPFTASVNVTNTGDTATYEVVQLYIAANDSPYGSAVPGKQLVSFEKVWLEPGETKNVSLTVDPADFAFYNPNTQDLSVFSGSYTLMVGRSSDLIESTRDIQVSGETLAALDASARTDVFASAFAADDVYYREYSRQSTLDSLQADNVTEGYYTVVSKTAGAWVGIANVNLDGANHFTFEVASKDAAGTIEVRLDSPTGALLATVNVPVTGPVTYDLRDSGAGDNAPVEITELDFTDVTAAFETQVTGAHDIYLVFQQPELRVASFTVGGATGDATLSLKGSDIWTGQSLEVPVSIQGNTGFDSLQFTIDYDPAVFQFDSAALSDALSAMGERVMMDYNEQDGTITMAFISAQSITEDLELGTLRFTVLSTGEQVEYTMDLKIAEAKNDGKNVNLAAEDAVFDVSSTGDVDGDGAITSNDARIALQIAVGRYTPTSEEFTQADVNQDGSVTASDAQAILELALGLN